MPTISTWRPAAFLMTLVQQLNSPDPGHRSLAVRSLSMDYHRPGPDIVRNNILTGPALISLCVGVPHAARAALDQLKRREDVTLGVEELKELSRSGHDEIRQFVAGHKLTPAETLFQMALYEGPSAVTAFAAVCRKDMKLVVAGLKKIVTGAEDPVVSLAVDHFKMELGIPLLLKIGREREGSVALEAVEIMQNGKCLGADELPQLARAANPQVRNFVAGLEITPESLLLEMAGYPDGSAELAFDNLGRREFLSSNNLTALAASHNQKVARAVAGNILTPVNPLVFLARTESHGPRALDTLIAKHKITPAVLTRLAVSASPLVVDYVIQNNNTPAGVLAALGRAGFFSAEVVLMYRGLDLLDINPEKIKLPADPTNRAKMSAAEYQRSRSIFRRFLEVLGRPGTPDKIKLRFMEHPTLQEIAERRVFHLFPGDPENIRRRAFPGLNIEVGITYEQICRLAPDEAARTAALRRFLKKPGLKEAELLAVAKGKFLAVEAFNLMRQKGLLGNQAVLADIKGQAVDSNVRIRATQQFSRSAEVLEPASKPS